MNSVTPKYFEELYPADAIKEQISKTLDLIKQGASVQILGLPGVGKSKLLRLLPYNKKVRVLHLGSDEDNYHFVYLDFAEVKGRTLVDVIKFITISLAYSLTEREMTDEAGKINSLLKEAISFQDEVVIFQALKQSIDYLTLEKNLTVVLMIDKFETYIQELTEQFFIDMKILRNRAKYKFSLVFALSRPLDQLVDLSMLSDFANSIIGNSVFMPLRDTGEDFRLHYIEEVTGKKDEIARNELLELTAGHGKLSIIAYETVLAATEKPTNIKEYLLGLRQMKNALYDLWNYLTPQEQMLIHTQQFFSEEVKFLQSVGLIQNNKIAIPLFAEFIKTIKSESEVFVYDVEKNEITKGYVNLSDQLTPSEFRLLKYLVINKDRVCEKEEIINAVWKDTQTQEGVTDQALDQIVYRLRKKIETDPNNPHYIQTIKGKGIKLSE
jgi:DNA-binding winged helix-turn-helix (wHTH) protein